MEESSAIILHPQRDLTNMFNRNGGIKQQYDVSKRLLDLVVKNATSTHSSRKHMNTTTLSQ